MPILKHPLANCDECPLRDKTYYAQPVKDNAKVVFVGGGPHSQHEGFKGGFLGTEAGSLLTSVCNFHSIPLSDVTYTTAVRCVGMSELKLSDKAKAVNACNGVLLEEIERIDPAAVVPLGTEAYRGVSHQKKSISAARVGPAKISSALGITMVPTVSPLACMVQESQFQFLVTDIGKLVHPAPKYVEPEYRVVLNANTAIGLLNDWLADAVDYITLDIEVAMEKDISFEHPDRYELLCLGVMFKNDLVVFAEDALTEEFWKLFTLVAKKHKVVAHNGKFDLSGLRPVCGKLDLNFDTMLAHYALDERSGVHGLKYLSQEYLGSPPYDDEITALMGASKDFGSVPKDILYKYNAYDVYNTDLLRQLFSKRLADTGMDVVHDFLIEASNMLQDVENMGMKIDMEYLGKLDAEYVESMGAQVEGIQAVAWPDFNPRSYQQIGQFLESNGVEVSSTNKDTLEKVLARIPEIESDFAERRAPVPDNVYKVKEFITLLLKYREDQKLYGTYIQGTKKRLYRGKVHPTFAIHGTVTGRLSAKNPNTQNIASNKSIKNLFVPRAAGFSLVHADYSQAELRMLSYLAKDSYFRDIFRDSSRDLFDELIVAIFPGSIKELEDPADWKHKRRIVKSVVYGLNYGRTEYGLSAGLGIDVEEARDIMTTFFSTIPDIIEWQEWIKNEVLEGRDLVTPFGRHRRYSLITRQNKQKVLNEALAFVPQSSASDCTLTAAIEITKEFKRIWGNDPEAPRIINLVHDDIIADARDSDANEVGLILRSHMIDVAERVTDYYVPFDVDADIAKRWGDF